MRNKLTLRKLMLDCLKNQKEEEVQKKSLEIKKKLFSLEVFQKAKTIMWYLAYGKEVRTHSMVTEAITVGKNIAVATCDIQTHQIIPCLATGLSPQEVHPGAYGIQEPRERRPVARHDIDLVIVPGLAFDSTGARLGRGLGYYDRFLATLRDDTPTIGLGYAFQIVDSLAPYLSPHDVRLSNVLFA